MRELLERLEELPPDNLLPTLAWLAGRELELDPDELKGALRRAELLLAAGGDPHRELDFDGRAVTALADDLDEPTPGTGSKTRSPVSPPTRRGWRR